VARFVAAHRWPEWCQRVPSVVGFPISPIVEFNGNGLTLVGSPGAQGGSGVDHGRNLVVARSSTDNQLYACESEAGVIP
jgi:hypothetical protein